MTVSVDVEVEVGPLVVAVEVLVLDDVRVAVEEELGVAVALEVGLLVAVFVIVRVGV